MRAQSDGCEDQASTESYRVRGPKRRLVARSLLGDLHKALNVFAASGTHCSKDQTARRAVLQPQTRVCNHSISGEDSKSTIKSADVLTER